MDAKELRIGNWVETYMFVVSGAWYDKEGVQHGVDTITEPALRQRQITIDDLQIISSSPLACYRPIPLTPDILIEAGFREGEDRFYSYRECPLKVFYDMEQVCYGDFMLEVTIKYLHQLQNIYYALTQTELPYNP